jgi:hypothetical protein
VHATLQQNPSAQKPEPHSAAAVHASPLFFNGTHAPFAQRLFGAQSVDTTHDVAHAVAPQMYGVQLCVDGTGHAAAEPRHVPRNVAVPAVQDGGRHCVPASANESVGHAAAVPLQFSATSHSPALTRHPSVFGANASTGHAAFTPSHDSATSQTPAVVRHTTVVGNGEHVPSTGPFAATLHA